MALLDSANPYQATIRRLSARDGFLSVVYSADSSYADSNTPDYTRNFNFSTTLTDSIIQSTIKSGATSAFIEWNNLTQTQSALDSSGFNDSGYANSVYNFTYKPRSVEAEPSYNPQTHQTVAYDSEGTDAIVQKYNVVALTDAEKGAYRRNFTIGREDLYLLLNKNSHLVKVHRKLGAGDDVSASWDASAGAGFAWGTDEIASYGVSTVERVAEGTYRVVFADAYDDANYTVVTGVGAENYGGAGASPRQLTVISRSADSLQVHCERTDDAVDEDNAYMAVQVSKQGAYDSAEVEFLTATTHAFGETLLAEVKTILGYTSDSAGDSDFLTYLRDA